MSQPLSHAQAARFYDFLGAGLDTQAFYEKAAITDLIAHFQLATCKSAVEFGIGTGRLASELLSAHLPADSIYLGLDVSATMVRLAKSRLRQFSSRVEVRQTDGKPRIDVTDGSFDRFISTYVFDLTSDDDIGAVLAQAHRVLKPDGLLGLVSLTDGASRFSRFVSTTWRGLYRISPWLVGGCRPIALHGFLSNTEWLIEYRNIIVQFGVPSEVIVARPLFGAPN